VTTPKHKQPLGPTIGFGVLMLQAMTAPFAFTSAVGNPATQPGWATGLYLAADLGAVASLVLIAFGRRTHRATARFAPATLVLPTWLVIALLSPLQQPSGAAAAMSALFAVVVGVLSAAPFTSRQGLELFAARGVTAPQAASTGTARPTTV